MTTPVDTVRRFYDALGRRGREPCDTDQLTREELAMTYRTLIAAAALTMGSVNAMATELPIYQASGFPMTAHQATVLTPANMVERLPDSAFIYGSPHQIAVLTPRHSETSQAAAAGGSMQARPSQVLLGDAKALDNVVRNPTASFTTNYQALEPFYHVVGDKSYIGYFQTKPSACSVWILSKPADESPAEKATQQQVEFDLPATQTMTFVVDSRGSNLSLRCTADAKSLSVTQTWVQGQ
jgi:hypothetical protein